MEGPSKPLGYLGILPLENLCQVVQSLDGKNMRKFLRTYPEYQEEILRCVRNLPRFETRDEALRFLEEYPSLVVQDPISLPYEGFGEYDSKPPESFQIPLPQVSYLSRRIRGDLYVSSEISEEILGSLDFFLARCLLYPKNFTGLKLEIKDPDEIEMEIRYRDGFLFLALDETYGEDEFPSLVPLIERLPITEFACGNTLELMGKYPPVLARKKIRIYHIVGDSGDRPFQVEILGTILEEQRLQGLPYTIETLIISEHASYSDFLQNDLSIPFLDPSGIRDRLSIPSVMGPWIVSERMARISGITLESVEDARKFIAQFPDLRSFAYSYLRDPLFPGIRTVIIRGGSPENLEEARKFISRFPDLRSLTYSHSPSFDHKRLQELFPHLELHAITQTTS